MQNLISKCYEPFNKNLTLPKDAILAEQAKIEATNTLKTNIRI